MSASNPQVSVFHFTSRISSAKIRKYKLATERGMGGAGGGNAAAITATPGNLDGTPSPSMEAASTEPPAKRPKLKLNVRRPSESADTIAVSRPKRDSTLRIRYSENMVIDSKDLEDAEPSQRKSRPSPAASSDLSSLTSVLSMEKEPTPAPAPAPVESKAKARDYSRDFMSYYVTGGDEEDEEPQVVEPAKAPPLAKQTSEPTKPQAAPPTPIVIPDQPVKAHRSRSHAQPPTYPIPTARLQPPRPPRQPLHQPVISVIDDGLKPVGPREPDTVSSLIKKLDTLSTALTNFGGIPALPLSPVKETPKQPEPQPSKEKKDVDDFLAMFDDEDDSDDKDKKDDKAGKIQHDLDRKLGTPSEPDVPLTHGIQFIQNALRSWAIQRTVAQYQQQRMQYEQSRHFESQPKRGPGRPRKFDTDEDFRTASPPTHIRIDLAKTPEGAAIAAFQDVLASGCLQVNALLPAPLTRSLRRLYMQIDHLINQGSRNEPQWQCMSYGAQIAAQKVRVEKWKIAHAKAQQEMVRQQQLAQQQVMQQMGIPQHQRHVTVEQTQQHHAMELERKRGLRDAAQQPHLTQYITNPLRLSTQSAGSPTGHAHSNQQGSGTPTDSPGANGVNGQQDHPNGLPEEAISANGKSVHLDKMSPYMPNFLPRSGQSMKFSFAPHNELALQTFGAQAFPTNESGPNIPNRGPMSANPLTSSGHAHSHSANGNVGANKQTPNDESDVEMLDVRPVSRKLSDDAHTALTNGNLTSTVPTTSGARSSSVPALSTNTTSPVTEAPNGIGNSVPASPAVLVETAPAHSTGNKGKGRAMDAQIAQPEVMVVDQ